jgi:hypothetical protein
MPAKVICLNAAMELSASLVFDKFNGIFFKFSLVFLDLRRIIKSRRDHRLENCWI